MSPALQNFQESQQLASCPHLASPLETQRRQCINGGDVAKVAAVIALHAPDRDNEFSRYSIARSNCIGFGAQLMQLVLATGDALRRQRGVEVVLYRVVELGLRPIQFNDAW